MWVRNYETCGLWRTRLTGGIMKHVAYIEDENLHHVFTERIIRRIREVTGADFLTVISAGEFCANGFPIKIPERVRVEQMAQCGADLVLGLPVISALGGQGKKIFASMALVQKLRSVDAVAVPVVMIEGVGRTELEQRLKSYAMTLFRENPEFKKELMRNLKENDDFSEAQRNTLLLLCPNSEQILKSDTNWHAVQLLDTMLQLYYQPRIAFVDVTEAVVDMMAEVMEAVLEDHFRREHGALNSIQRVGDRVSERLENLPDFQVMMSIFGSREEIVNLIREKLPMLLQTYDFPTVLSHLCQFDSLKGKRAELRLYLTRLIFRIRHEDMMVAELYSYCPYGKILFLNPERPKEVDSLIRKSWVDLTDGPDEKADASRRIFYEIDRRQQELLQD